MNTELESIVLLLQAINSQLTKPVFDEVKIKEELNNAKDAQQNSAEINMVLHELIRTDSKNASEMVRQLIELHLKLCDAIWHIEQTHEMVKDLVAHYRASL